jgi:methyl halide transferase
MTVDWKARYAAAQTPWDLGGPHPELLARIASGAMKPPAPGARACVPGCGRGWDAVALAEAGWSVTAVDLVDTLAERLVPVLSGLGGRFVAGDALAFEDAPFELLFDHTFFCALDPSQRPHWGEMATRLLAPGGRIAALVFPVGKPPEDGGPPFGMSAEALMGALGPGWQLTEDVPVSHPAGRAWDERWAGAVRGL